MQPADAGRSFARHDPCLAAHIAGLRPPHCDRRGPRLPIRTALVVFAIVRVAGDAANAQRLTGGGAFPIDGAKLRTVAKLHEVEVAENIGVFDDAHGDQAAAPQQIEARTVHRNNRTGDLGLRQNERRSERRFFQRIKSASPAVPIMLFISIPHVPVLPVFSINGEMDHCVRPLSFLAP